MNVITSLGLNTALILAIVGICEYIKLSLNGKFKKLYFLFPVILSIGAGLLISDPFTFKEVTYNSFVYFGISVIAYTIVKKTIIGENTNIIKSITEKLFNNKDTKDKE